MRQYGRVVLSLLILAVGAVGAFRSADALQYSLFTYQSPLSVMEFPPGEQLPRQVERVLVIIIGGLGYTDSRLVDMPNLDMLVEAGAASPMISRPPTYPLAAWTTLLTGLWPELNHAYVMEDEKAAQKPPAFDDLFTVAHDAGLGTAFAGFEGWRALLPTESVDARFFVTAEDAMADGEVAQSALGFMVDPRYNLVVVYFSQTDEVGQSVGTGGAAYANAARQVDNYLRQIIRLVDLSDSVLVVTSDHGITGDGHLGGGEPELTELPFVMLGQHIVPGAYSSVQQVDLAPTVAALLGARLPSAAQGRPLYEMMRLERETLTQGYLELAAQKVALTAAYLAVLGEGDLSRTSREDLDSARRAFVNGNQTGALELARLISDEATAELARVRAARIHRERLSRLGIIALGLPLSLLFLWSRRRPTSLVSLLGGAVTVGIYYGLYRLRGYTLSLSSLDSPEILVAALARGAAISVAGGALWVLLGLVYRDERDWTSAITTGYDYGLYAVFLSALPALFAYWQHGATIHWYLPDLGLVLLHFVALLQVSAVALLAIPLPWLIALLAWGIGRWRSYSESRVQAWDPMARLRRR
jgi:hypothetical protein